MQIPRIVGFGCGLLMVTPSSCLTATEYAMVNHPSAEDVAGIQQTLGLFPVSIDLKQFDLLDAVFSVNATANFTGRSVIVGVPAIKSYLMEGLASLKSQHNLGTLYINMTGPFEATSYHWLQGTFFGAEQHISGQTFSNFGYYKDDLVKTRGRWFIQNRSVGAFVSVLSSSMAPILLRNAV